MEIKTDLIKEMICGKCKYFQTDKCKHIERMSGTTEIQITDPEGAGCGDWTKKEIKDDPKTIEAKEILRFMYEEIRIILKDYLIMQDFQYDFIALWILGTYLHENFNTYPFLFFNAMRGSGKTRALRLISSLGANGDGSVENNLTEACLFRIPRGRTTCIDEVEQIGNKEKQTLRELLNAAYKKGMKVRRMKKTKRKNEIGIMEEIHIAEEFEPFFPIAMANINGIEEVLEDRAITLILEKSDDPEKTRKSENFGDLPKIRWIKTTLNMFSVDSVVCGVKNILEKWNFWLKIKYNYTNNTNNTNNTNYTNYTNIHLKRYLEATKEENFEIDSETDAFFNKLNDSGITGRNFELFIPIFILSRFMGEDIFERTFSIAKEIVQAKKKEEHSESKDVSLYQFVAQNEEIYAGFTPIKELTNKFKVFSGNDSSEDKEINDKWMGRALKRLNLILDKRRMSSGMEVTLNFLKAQEKLKIFKF